MFSKSGVNPFIEFTDRSGAIDVPAKTTRIMNGIAVFKVLLIWIGVIGYGAAELSVAIGFLACGILTKK